jgi:hypothetical protein
LENLVAGIPSKPQGEEAREGPVVRPALKEAESETASRRTGIGYEALPTGASGRVSAKLLRPKGRRRRPGDRAGKVTTLTWGDLASPLKGGRQEAEREVSRGNSSGAEAGSDATELAGSRKIQRSKGPNEGESGTTMSLGRGRHQKPTQVELPFGQKG